MSAKKPSRSRRSQPGGRVTPKGTRPAESKGHARRADRSSATLPREQQTGSVGPVQPRGEVSRTAFLPGHRGNR